MLGGLSTLQKLVGAAVLVLAIIGWGLAVSSSQRAGGLAESLSQAEVEKGQLSEKISAAQAELSKIGEAATRLDELTAEVTSTEQQLTEVAQLVADGEAKLAGLGESVNAAETELAALQEQSEVYERLIASGPDQFLTSRASVNVRAEPSTDSEVLVTLPEGFTVEVFEVVEGGEWFKIGGVGYVFHDLIEPKPEGEAQPSGN